MEFDERMRLLYPDGKYSLTTDYRWNNVESQWTWNNELNLWEKAPEVAKKESAMDGNKLDDFELLMESELGKGGKKYGEGDSTLEFLRGIDPVFELGAIAKYVTRIANGDERGETDIVKIATYAYLYWKRHYRP